MGSLEASLLPPSFFYFSSLLLLVLLPGLFIFIDFERPEDIFIRFIARFCMLCSQNAEILSRADPGWSGERRAK